MPTPSIHRPHQLALAIALSLGCIDITMAQQAVVDTAVEAPAKKVRVAAWPKKDDLLSIKNFIGPMEHAVKPASLKPPEPVTQLPSVPAAPEPVDLAAHLYDFPETSADSLQPKMPETPAEDVAAWPVNDDLLAVENFIGPMEYAVEPNPITPAVAVPPAPPLTATAEPIDSAAHLYEFPDPADDPVETVEDELPITFDNFANADSTTRTLAEKRYETIDGVSLKLGEEDDLFIVNHGVSFAGEIQGGGGKNVILLDSPDGGTLDKTSNFLGLRVAQGAWSLTGKDDFDRGAEVLAGATLFNMGSIAGDAIVYEGGRYGGQGEVRDLYVEGTLLVSEPLGAPRIKGNLTFTKDATLSYAVTAAGNSPTIIVEGIAALEDASLEVSALPGDYPDSSDYKVLKAGQVEGEFGRVTSNLAYMTPTLSYTKTEVALNYARNGVPIEDFAADDNAREFGRSVEDPAAKTSETNAAVTALLTTDKATATYALEQLTGDSNANLAKATLNSDSPVSATLLSAMRQLDSAAGFGNQKSAPRLAAGSEDNGRVWLQALGHGGTLDRDHDALQTSTKGLVLGADWSVDEEWRIGVMGGKSDTSLDSRDLDGDLDSWHLGAYALRQNGPMSLRLGATYSSHDGSTKRRVAFNGFSDRPEGRYDASTQQAFAEVGYNMGRANVSIEPFASLGYQRYQRDGYTEKGGAAALKVHGQTQANLNSTFGLRLAKINMLDNGMQLTPRFSAGWKHTYGDIDSDTRQRLVTGGKNFTVSGAPLDRDSLLVDAGLDLGLSAKHTLGVGLNGEIGTDSRNHGVMGQWRMTF
ncbi:autotransporter outer membrane beta-barrel domain-containing protein [Pseudomonas sp. RT6P73]